MPRLTARDHCQGATSRQASPVILSNVSTLASVRASECKHTGEMTPRQPRSAEEPLQANRQIARRRRVGQAVQPRSEACWPQSGRVPSTSVNP